MAGGLEHPLRGARAVLEHLQDLPLVAVVDRQIGNPPCQRGDHAPVETGEAACGEGDALDGQVGPELVHGQELGLDVGPELLLALPRLQRVREAGFGQRHRVQCLGADRGSQVGMQPQQLEQDRGARAGGAGDHQRGAHGLSGDLRGRVNGCGEQQPGAQRAQQLLLGHQPAEHVHRRGVQVGGQRLEALLPVGVAQVAGRHAAERGLGQLQQLAGVYGHQVLGAPPDRVTHEDDAPHPVRPGVPLRHRWKCIGVMSHTAGQRTSTPPLPIRFPTGRRPASQRELVGTAAMSSTSGSQLATDTAGSGRPGCALVLGAARFVRCCDIPEPQ